MSALWDPDADSALVKTLLGPSMFLEAHQQILKTLSKGIPALKQMLHHDGVLRIIMAGDGGLPAFIPKKRITIDSPELGREEAAVPFEKRKIDRERALNYFINRASTWHVGNHPSCRAQPEESHFFAKAMPGSRNFEPAKQKWASKSSKRLPGLNYLWPQAANKGLQVAAPPAPHTSVLPLEHGSDIYAVAQNMLDGLMLPRMLDLKAGEPSGSYSS